MAEPGVFETIYNCRAIRYFTNDPVPDELVDEAPRRGDPRPERLQSPGLALRGGHRPRDQEDAAGVLQAVLRRVRVDDGERPAAPRRQRGDAGARREVRGVPLRAPARGAGADPALSRLRAGSHHGRRRHAEPGAEVPVLVDLPGGAEPPARVSRVRPRRVPHDAAPHVRGADRTLLELPENAETMALIPIGWPSAKFGPVKRVPVAEITSRNRFGQAW